MRVGVVGAGAAGLTAARRAVQAGHDVVVFEANDHVGGRTHSARFGPGHHLDTGAGWLTSAYTRTLELLDELGERDRLIPMRASAQPDLVVDGERFAGSIAPRSAGGRTLVPVAEAAALREWFAGLAGHPTDLSVRLENDDESALDHIARVSPAASSYVIAPMFEGLFAPIGEQSAAMLRAWVASGTARYWQVDGGMDSPWQTVARGVDVRIGDAVAAVHAAPNGVEIVTDTSAHAVDACILAVPPPIGRTIVDDALVPSWYEDVAYFGQCRLYVARRGTPQSRVHVRPLPMGLITSVEWQSGADGAWGACPDDMQWVLVCANGAHNDELVALDDETLAARLWDGAREHVPDLFALEDADVVHVVRWRHAVPTLAPGHFRRMAAYERATPLIPAGDWTHQACVEGAVRSGEAAAEALGSS